MFRGSEVVPRPVLSRQTFSDFKGDPGKLRPYLLLLASLLLPACIDPFFANKACFGYLYLALTHLAATCFCVAAGRRSARERPRWRILAVAQVLHVLIYLDASVHDAHLFSYALLAWFGNLALAASMTLMLPALMSTRLGRGRPLRILDTLLVLVFAAILMFSLGSGELPGDGPTRIWVETLVLALLSALALVARFSQANTEIRHFTNVVSKTIWVDLLTSLILNGICYRWFPNLTNGLFCPIAALPPLLLCYWTTQTEAPGALERFPVDRAVIDSLQPSVLTVCSVVLILFTFHKRPVVVGAVVVSVVLLHAARTQIFYFRLFRERHNLRTQTEHLHKLATRDPLTGIANRRWFEETVVQQLQEPFSYPCSLLMVDTDSFKEINDSRGHGAGDAVLCMVADVLQREIDGVDRTCASRIGGDEFAVLLPSTPQQQATQYAERIRKGVEELGSVRCHGVTVSIGVATLLSDGSRAELLQSADEALYRAKAAGRNAVRI